MPKVISDPNNEKLSDELQAALLEIVRKCEQEDSWVRKQQIREWKKHERFWHGIQYIYWSETTQDWLSPVDTRVDGRTDEEHREEADGPFYDYVINIYRAYGESIIAALAAQVPTVRFPPDDADSDDDQLTSKVYGQIADLIQRHNKAKLLLLKTLLCLWNQGIVAAYHCPKSDKAYGMMKVPQYGDGMACPECDYQSKDTTEQTCPNCMTPPNGMPSQPVQLQPQSVVTDYVESPKTRVSLEVYGPLFVKVSHWAQSQKDFGYLALSVDQPKSYLKDLFPNIRTKIESNANQADQYEKIGRAPSNFTFTVNDNSELLTLRRVWLRTWQFEILEEDQRGTIDELKKLYPDGCYVCFVGDVYAESRSECLDAHWTIGKAGLSQYIHSDALGKPLIPLQEIKNVTKNLTLETVEQGIATVFADPQVLNFDDYSRHELRPGTYVPASKRVGERLADAFYEGPKATLSKEVPVLEEANERDSQFVTGGFPSIYGGQIEGSSRTAAEYDMSRQMALQRLSICWALLNSWWAETMEKCVRLFVKNVVSDERYVVKDKNNYVNVWIRRADLTGKVGEVEPEGADSFPVTLAQKQSLLLKLVGLNNEFLNAAIFDVQNRPLVADAFGFPEFKLPQENQRLKQVKEIQQMVDQGMPVPIEPEIDDDNVHIEVLKDYLAGPQGFDTKITNPQAYQLCMVHLQEHLQNQAQQQAAQQAQQVQQQVAINQSKQKPSETEGLGVQ